jgi:hypothetical protein
VQRSPGDAKHRPVTMHRRAGTHERGRVTYGPRISSAPRRKSGGLRSIRGTQTRRRLLAAPCARVVHETSAQQRAWGMPGARCTRSRACRIVSTRVSHHGRTGITRHSRTRMVLTASFALSPVIGYRMHTSDSILSVGSTKNVSHQSHLTRLWQYLMAQGGASANPLKKNLVSRCVNLIAGDRALLSPSPRGSLLPRSLTPAIEASGPHDFAVREIARSSVEPPASTASQPYVRDDRETPLLCEPGWREMCR